MQSVYCHGGHQVTKRSFSHLQTTFSASLNSLECMCSNVAMPLDMGGICTILGVDL